jgi:hypothetical protein
MNKTKIFFLLFLLSIAISLIISPLRGIAGGINYCSLLGFVIYFFFIHISLKKFQFKLSPVNIFVAVLSGLLILQLPLRIIDFKETLGSLPDFLLHLSGILLGYVSGKQSPKIRGTVFLLGLCICVFMFFKGYEMWLHKLNFGTFTGKTEQTVVPNFRFADEKGQLFSIIREKGYSFPVYHPDMEDPVLHQLGVDKYPTVLVFDKESRLVFRGSIKTAKDFIDSGINNSEM